MKVVTSEEMRRIDRETIRSYGISGQVLMERAGLAVAKMIQERWGTGRVLVLSGGGNNGGDGLVAARILHSMGREVRVLLLQPRKSLSHDCLTQYDIAKRIGVSVEFRTTVTGKDLHGAIVVDAIFGTGINKPIASPISGVIAAVNKSTARVLSVDMPSGISSDNGQIMGDAVRADATVTFGLPKRGHLLYPGADFTGTLYVEDIGFPRELLFSLDIKTEAIERSDAIALIPERPKYSHKGDYGHVLVLAGSRGRTGAALMTARACLRSGAGMVTIGVPETLSGIMQSRATEEMVLPLPDTGRGSFSDRAVEEVIQFLNDRADVLAMGPGISTDQDVIRLVRDLVISATVPMVIDADGINCLAEKPDLLKKTRAPIILTPHMGEMARLLSGYGKMESRESPRSRSDIERERIDTARSFSQKTKVHLVLKGAPTVIADPEGQIYINRTGNPGMATAGSGDVLTGIIASMLGQGLAALESAILGTYLHGLAADEAAARIGLHSLIASDITESLPGAFLSLQKNG